LKKQKKRGAFFLFFLPQMLKRRTSALLPITISFPKQWIKRNWHGKLNNAN